MKFATLVKGLAVAAVLSSTSLVSSVSFANSPVNGVSCPSGFNSSFSGGVLKCEKDVTSQAAIIGGCENKS